MASQPYLGTVFIFAGNFAPRGYLLCQGQLLSIAQNSALFAIIGTTYGGDGVQTFGLPNLQGRHASGTGTGPGLAPVVLGQAAGVNNVSILTSNLPPHSHPVGCDKNGAANTSPANGLYGNPGLGQTAIYSSGPANATMKPTMLSMTGSNIPIAVQNPYLGINFMICTEGIFPSQN